MRNLFSAKKWLFLAAMVAVLAMIIPVALALDSPVQPVPEETYIAVITPAPKTTITPLPQMTAAPHPEVMPESGIESAVIGLTEKNSVPAIYIQKTTSERFRPGIEIHLYDPGEEDEAGNLEAVLPYEEAVWLDYSRKEELKEEKQAQFTDSYAAAVSRAATDKTILTNFFWIDIPLEFKELLRTKEAYVDDNGGDAIDGEYLELNIVKPGTNLSCTVNEKEMDVIDRKDGTVTLKLTETGAVAVFAGEALSTALKLTAEASIPDVIPAPYLDLLLEPVPALAICKNIDDETETAVATIDVTLIPVENISLLEPADQGKFLLAFEEVRDTPNDRKLRYFFWIDIPDHYADMLSGDLEEGKYLRMTIDIPSADPFVTVNGVPMETELIDGTTYAVKLTEIGAIAVYSDYEGSEKSDEGAEARIDTDALSDADADEDDEDPDASWHRTNG